MEVKKCAVLVIALPSLNSCNKEEIATSKNVNYSVVFNKIEENSDLILKGEYINKTGETVKVDKVLPFNIELKGVPLNIKTRFDGYIFSTKAGRLVVGTMEMVVTQNPNGKRAYEAQKKVDLSTTAPLGFSGENLKKETSFDFQEI